MVKCQGAKCLKNQYNLMRNDYDFGTCMALDACWVCYGQVYVLSVVDAASEDGYKEDKKQEYNHQQSSGSGNPFFDVSINKMVPKMAA